MTEKKKNEREELADEVQTEEEQEDGMEIIHSCKANVVAKPKGVEEMADKAIAKKLSPDEEREHIEKNVLGEFYD